MERLGKEQEAKDRRSEDMEGLDTSGGGGGGIVDLRESQQKNPPWSIPLLGNQPLNEDDSIKKLNQILAIQVYRAIWHFRFSSEEVKIML